MNETFPAGIVIVTRNREKDLREVLQKLKSDPKWAKLPVWVHDDASDKVSADYFSFLKENSYRLVRNPRRFGLIGSRNQSNMVAPFEFIFSLDDDSCFLDSTGPEAAIEYLKKHADVGALSFPLVEPQDEKKFHTGPCAIFIGCAHVLRKEAFVKAGGYRADFIHQGEEVELSMRLWSRGAEVHGFGDCRVHHWASETGRDWERMGFYGPRNRLWTHFLRTPLAFLPKEGFRTAGSTAKLAWQTGLWMTHFEGLGAGLGRGILSTVTGDREPMKREAYEKWLALPRNANDVTGN